MSGATAPARDSSQADLIGPGDSCVPDEPRSRANISRGSAKGEGSVASIDNARKGFDDPIDAAGDEAAAFLERGNALACGFQLGLEAVALGFEGFHARVDAALSLRL